uniref:Gag-pol n=2 Tax=Oryza sativa subsp. japonica TaxID=39947 RepID=Q10IS6_ORYSJ|nr:putative gag-pol precursor [Oryza sativa Japonica Group]ABF96913.1 retrotransposon protein, putative, Ty3-gypsy subclass [Oryza sativa Japonica Group]
MSYYVDPRTNVPQYPLYPVYGYPLSTVARQVGGLGAQGSTTMKSSLVDNSINTGLIQGVPTSTMLVWTQVGEIVFPIYTTIPISASPSMIGSENTVAITPGDSMSKDPPAVAENGTSMTYEPEKDPSAAKPYPSDKDHAPTRTTSEVTKPWCPIHKTRKHNLQACWVFLNVQAKIHACKEHGIQRASPTRDVYCPIHKTKNHDFSSCKVLLRAMKTPLPKVQQSKISLRDADKEQGATLISDRFVGVIDIDPHEPSVLYLLEDYGSSSSSTPRVNPGESLRDYVRRFNECRNTIPEITDASVIRAFKTCVRDRYTTQELATRRRLFEVIDRCAHADDALRRKNNKPKTGGEKKPAKGTPEPSKKKSGKSGKRKAQAEVPASEYERPPKHLDPQGSDTKRIWCPIYKSDRHSLEDCLIFKKSLEKQLALEKGKRVRVVEKAAEATTQDSNSAYPDSDLHVSHIFGGSKAYSSKREYKKVEREICSTWQEAAPKMKWSEQKIEFSDEDHPKAAVIPGRYPIVVEPTIRNIKEA